MKTKIKRYRNERVSEDPYLAEDTQGMFVLWEDYEWLSDYTDHLVSFSRLPCLPKDIEVLRDANAAFAEEVAKASSMIEDLKAENARLRKVTGELSNYLFKANNKLERIFELTNEA